MYSDDEHGGVAEADAVEEDATDGWTDEGAQGEGARPQTWDQTERLQVVRETMRPTTRQLISIHAPISVRSVTQKFAISHTTFQWYKHR